MKDSSVKIYLKHCRRTVHTGQSNCQFLRGSTIRNHSLETFRILIENKLGDMESMLWLEFFSGHPNMQVARACLENVSPPKFWSLADICTDLFSHLFVFKSGSWVIYTLTVAFSGSLILRAHLFSMQRTHRNGVSPLY